MIVVAGRRTDPPLAAVWTSIQELGLPGAFADVTTRSVALDGTRVLTPGAAVDRGSLRGFYQRDDSAADPALATRLHGWAELTPRTVRVINRRRSAACTTSRPAQALLIARAGFRVPIGLLTTSPDAAREFVRRHQRVVVRSASAVRGIVRLAEPEEDFSAVQWCPTQFQAWVPGDEFRVHVVGPRVFTSRVLSDDVDYRYGSVAVVPGSLPVEVSDRCVALVRQLGLELAGLELRRTPEGDWFCLDANASPVWTAYDPDGAIATALALHLAGD
ncbi:hypothetical protein LKO27_14945 [Tessaracoccus sp. OS52]|uniref:hypothetical protein n=1 Tax=Tessaracoccus sp. OS52 TaxID=2886691 RepID=UPI001D115836|nr:hypothetical protein [Tessaracoccus sp. OS52]MCC2594698.1 hypothetical protein [Tessaracoccus sp. OS52]